MTDPVARHRPKQYPPPEFPARRPKLFARTPPAVFPAILGLLGLTLALRAGLRVLDLPQAAADIAAGISLSLWGFAILAYLAKLARRPGSLADDLRVLPGRAGLAAATVGGMAAAAVLTPFSPNLAVGLLITALLLHAGLALLLIRVLLHMPPEARRLNPTFHLSFVGQIVGALAALGLGFHAVAAVLFWATLPVAVLIWAISALRLRQDHPPPPLRPLLAIHATPAGVLACVASLMGMHGLASALLLIAVAITLGLAVCARWLVASGVSPLWGAFGFPLTAVTVAMLTVGGVWATPGILLLAVGCGAVPLVAWIVLKEWPGGRLAARTNASEA
ncbi:tellurium resistance protein [Tabrizicola sp.]|uniref:SLAC1 family transporter n=1 Tax=Tabrizicola sp. TaxID=2005166 RepID=UPI00286A5AEE|nr:tellurium resistance protein [Tabrizicola sp.]